MNFHENLILRQNIFKNNIESPFVNKIALSNSSEQLQKNLKKLYNHAFNNIKEIIFQKTIKDNITRNLYVQKTFDSVCNELRMLNEECLKDARNDGFRLTSIFINNDIDYITTFSNSESLKQRSDTISLLINYVVKFNILNVEINDFVNTYLEIFSSDMLHNQSMFNLMYSICVAAIKNFYLVQQIEYIRSI